MTPTPMDYTRLLQRMKECGMTQSELAKAAGIKPERMKQKLNSLLMFTAREVENICRVLDVPLIQHGDFFCVEKGDEEIPKAKQVSVDEKRNVARPRGTDSAEVIKVIKTVGLEGSGTPDDPCRLQTKYWSLNGELLAVGYSES